MRLSTSTCIHEHILWDTANMFYSCEDSIRSIARSGYKIMDMNFASYSLGTLPMTRDNWEEFVKNQKELVDSLGLEVSQAHAHFYGWNGLTAEQKEWNEELVRRSIIGAGIIGAKWLVIHPGTVSDGTYYSYKKSLEENLKYYRALIPLAQKHNVGIAIENMIESKIGRRYASSTEELMELYDKLNDSTFGICWDFGHANLCAADQCAALRDIGSALKALHVDDNRGEKDDHLLPYFGKIKWEPIMKTLKEINYKGDFTYEIHGFMNGLPDGLHDSCLRFTKEVGEFLLTLAK